MAAPPPAPVAAPEPPAKPTVNCSLYRSLIEQNRVTYQAKLANLNVQWNHALNTGDLDKAAALYNTASAVQQQWTIADQQLAMQYPGC